MNRLALARVALVVASVSLAMVACGDDADSNGPNGGAGEGGESTRGGTSSAGTTQKPQGGSAPIGGGGDRTLGGEGGVGASVGGEGGMGSSMGGEGGAGTSLGGQGGDTGSGGAAGASGEGGEGGHADGCVVHSTYGDLEDPAGVAGVTDTGNIYYGLLLQDGTPRDELWVELWDGFGVFEDGITTLTDFELTGDDLNWSTCAVCVYIEEDAQEGTNFARGIYMATGGTVTLTSVEGQLTGSLSNVTFEHVLIEDEEPFVSTPAPDGCTTAVESLSFDAQLFDI